ISRDEAVKILFNVDWASEEIQVVLIKRPKKPVFVEQSEYKGLSDLFPEKVFFRTPTGSSKINDVIDAFNKIVPELN
ncbi:MAG: hypothetical protein ACRCZG_02510, partial [Culicoidibacterales bacterium]